MVSDDTSKTSQLQLQAFGGIMTSAVAPQPESRGFISTLIYFSFSGEEGAERQRGDHQRHRGFGAHRKLRLEALHVG